MCFLYKTFNNILNTSIFWSTLLLWWLWVRRKSTFTPLWLQFWSKLLLQANTIWWVKLKFDVTISCHLLWLLLASHKFYENFITFSDLLHSFDSRRANKRISKSILNIYTKKLKISFNFVYVSFFESHSKFEYQKKSIYNTCVQSSHKLLSFLNVNQSQKIIIYMRRIL